MNKKNYWLLMLIILIGTHSTIFGQEWLWRIKPLETNISEVEKMFNISPKQRTKDQYLFELPEGNLFVGISLGKCVDTTWEDSWNVNKGTVVDILFYSTKRRKPSYYKLKKEGMRVGYDNGHQTYTSDELGLYYSVEFGKVSGIHIYPSSKYNQLKCESKLKETSKK